MNAPTEDRRVRRTKAALRQALIELVLERGYQATSIDALVDRADVTRATFYAHFPNKGQLLADVVDRFADDVIAALDEPGVAARPAGRLAVLLERSSSNRDVLRIIVRGQGDGVPLRRFTERVEDVLTQDLRDRLAEAGLRSPIDPHLVTKLRAAQVVAAVAWFVEAEDADAEATAADVNLVSERGWAEATGLRPR